MVTLARSPIITRRWLEFVKAVPEFSEVWLYGDGDELLAPAGCRITAYNDDADSDCWTRSLMGVDTHVRYARIERARVKCRSADDWAKLFRRLPAWLFFEPEFNHGWALREGGYTIGDEPWGDRSLVRFLSNWNLERQDLEPRTLEAVTFEHRNPGHTCLHGTGNTPTFQCVGCAYERKTGLKSGGER